MKNANEVFENVVNMLELENNCPRLISAQCEEGLWQLRIRTLSLVYDVFYDEESGELPGVNFEPITDLEAVYGYKKHSFGKTA